MRPDLKQEMPFTAAFLLEVLRFRSTVNLTYRKAVDTVHVGNYTIPKGTRVIIIVLIFQTVFNGTKIYEDILRSINFLPFYTLIFTVCPTKIDVFFKMMLLAQLQHISVG